MRSVLELPQTQEPNLESIKAYILGLGLKTQAGEAEIPASLTELSAGLMDLRSVFLHRAAIEAIARAFWARYADQAACQLAGMETAAIPLLTALRLLAPRARGPVNTFIIRKQRKSTGLCNAIEGVVTDEPILLVDDLINTGASAEKARAVIAATGRSLWGVFAVIDYRSQRSLRWREQHGLAVDSLFTLAQFGLSLTQDPPVCKQAYRQLWCTKVPGANPFNVIPKSTPALVGSRLYRGCDAGKMQAFDADTGAVVWEYQARGVGSKGIISSPLVHEGRVYFGAYNGVIYCLDAASGAQIWSQPYGEWVGASPIVVPQHRLVYFGIEYARPWAQGGLGAFDMDTGTRVWEHPVGKFQHGSPAHWKGGDLILWGSADHEMVALRARTGEVVWSFPTRRSVKYAPAVAEELGLVAFASFDTSIYVLEVATGRRLGEWETGDLCYSTPLFVGKQLFCGSGDGRLYVIDLERLEIAKKIEMSARVYGSPLLVDGRVIVGASNGVVIEIDPDTLECVGRLQMPDAVTNAVAATPDGRRIYVSTCTNQLYGFERVAASTPVDLSPHATW